MPADSQTSEKLMFYDRADNLQQQSNVSGVKKRGILRKSSFCGAGAGCISLSGQSLSGFCFPTVVFNIVRPGVAQVLVENLVRLHYDGKLFVCVTNAYNLVDFSVLSEFAENEAFIRAFATCVTIARRVETQALVTPTTRVKQFLSEKPKENVSNMLAYAMLKMCDISFDDNYLDEYFLHGDEKLYAKYIAESEKQTH